MERIVDKIAALPPNANYFSLEFFPPKTSMGSANLRARLDRMSRALRPLFVTVTWGAGGSTATKSLELAELCQRDLGLTTCLHLTCTNMNQDLVDTALEEAKVLGIRNILALRGDPPRKEEYGGVDTSAQTVEFEWAIDLVKYIRRKYGDYFCIGVAAYPEGHSDESHPTDQSLEHDLPCLVEKVKAGADFIMTQLFFDVQAYDKFEDRLRNHESGVFKEIPIIPGMMPIQSYQILKRTTKLSHARLPEVIGQRLDAVKSDDGMVKKVGVDILSEIVEQVKDIKSRSGGPKGFHFYTLNLEKAVTFILERTRLITCEPIPAVDITDADFAIVDKVRKISVNGAVETNGSTTPNAFIAPSFQRRHRPSVGSDPHNRVIVDNISNPSFEAQASEAGQSAPINSRATTLAISEGEGSLGREATWDDFPNGRWGDARSPAYGEIDGYGVSLHMSVNSAIRLWGQPRSSSDITDLFIKHIKGEISAIPWSEEGLSPETSSIEAQLLKVNSKGWWTVASQPAVNGVKSGDPVFGWGPENGFVFQKAFVELFVPSSSWHSLLPRLRDNTSLSFYAMNAAGDFATSDPPKDPSSPSSRRSSEDHSGSSNAVTWGVFPGKEIITPTIIEEVSFRAWAEEAFGIWAEWERVYPVGSEERKCLGGERAERWLVNIISNEFVEKDSLWEFLLEA